MNRLSIREVVRQLRGGQLTAPELCSRCIERARRSRHLNAVVTERFEESLETAHKIQEKIDRGEAVGELVGIPITVKDNFSTKDVRTTCASAMLHNYTPPYTATVVQRMLDEDAILLGKTNLDEFAMGSGTTEGSFGPTRNVWKYPLHGYDESSTAIDGAEQTHPVDNVHVSDSDWFVAGGSSGGSAVAVASGSCMAALGSDTGGSVRHPASFCGVVGFKPTYGLCSRHGLIPLVNSLDVPGVLARTVDDVAAVLGAIAGHDPLDSTTVTDPPLSFSLPDEIDVSGLHIGIPKEYHAPGLSGDMLEAWSRAADIFERGGARVSEVSLPHTQYSIAVYSVLCAVEVASNMARYDGIEYGRRSGGGETSAEGLYAASRQEGFLDIVKGRILAGNYFLLEGNYERYFLHAQRVRRLIWRDFQEVFGSGVDAIVAPAALSESPTFAEFRRVDGRTQNERQDVFTQPVNQAGLPAVVVPTLLSPRGLPIGLQLIGQHFKDRDLLSMAKWFERQVQFPHHIVEEQFHDPVERASVGKSTS